ncbi:Vmc-like lipoprotein signal peptide domain-containing protein [Ureaplasma zalophigenitalium]|uniref:Lipoprotein n=1 Tax=Ureaplasma zalophigenitalium TaxID=907723 RepID=A0ABT3BPV3_9BACT|nr:hypothetical protein [Ureaplasma zalophigenitalium]MCV3754228.1 hypothetical protein [Ureaplasma zalophigenitalium]
MKKNKLNKKLLFSSLGILAAIGSITAVATSCHKPQSGSVGSQSTKLTTEQLERLDKILNLRGDQTDYSTNHVSTENYWSTYWNSPFEQIRNFAKDLDSAIDLSKSSTFKPLIASGQHEPTFVEEVEKQINALKHDIKMYANSPFWKKLRAQNATVGIFSRVGAATLDVNNMNQIYMYQPLDLPLLFSSPDYDRQPGLGMKFPVPKNDSILELIDNQWSIGGTNVYSKGSTPEMKIKTLNGLIDSFENSFDRAIFIYNDRGVSSKFKGPKGETFSEQLIAKPDFALRRFVKENPEKNVIFSGNEAWSASYGLTGMHWLLQKYSEWFGMPKEELDGLKAKEKFKLYSNPTPLFTEDDLMTTSDGKKIFKEGRDPYKRHRADKTDIYFYASSFHVLDQAISLGLRPDYISTLEISTSDRGIASSIEHLKRISGDWLKNIKVIGDKESFPGTGHIKGVVNTYETDFYKFNINTIGSGYVTFTSPNSLINKNNWSSQIEKDNPIFSSFAFTSRRFRSIDRMYPENQKDTQAGVFIGFEQYAKWKANKK